MVNGLRKIAWASIYRFPFETETYKYKIIYTVHTHTHTQTQTKNGIDGKQQISISIFLLQTETANYSVCLL
jgi:hypothetical protein